MSKKMMLLALSVVSAALFALPAVASATPAHIEPGGSFTVTPGKTLAGLLENTNGERVECHKGVTGTGSFEGTTTGTMTLEFQECTASGFKCNTHVAEGGTEGTTDSIRTRALPIHLITDPVSNLHAAILVTPNAAAASFASFTCAGGLIKRTVTGNGVIGTVKQPTCGETSTTATITFSQSATTGVQSLKNYTGTNYNLISNGFEAAETAEGVIHFLTPQKLVCT